MIRAALTTSLCAAVIAAPATAGHESFGLLGFLDLVERLDGDVPTGAGVGAMQIEARDGEGDYGPNQAHAEFAGKTFFEMSGATGTSSHASTVGKLQYGLVRSIAPEVDEIYLYSATEWAGAGFLRTGAGGSVAPLPTPGDVKVVNNSWVGGFSSAPSNNDALRRADLVVTRDQVLFTNGVNNEGGSNEPLLSHMYNGIAVGIREGVHVSDDTSVAFDGPGRMKPEIVAPEDFTSFATPMVNAMAALLIETARETPGLVGSSAERSEVIKVAILGGAVHEDIHDGEWSNEPVESGPARGVTARPLDPVVGVGSANIDRSHRILTAGEQDGTLFPPLRTSIDWTGWDLVGMELGGRRYYRFDISEVADEIAITATWHRSVRLLQGTWNLADFDLFLWRVDLDGSLESLVGDLGVDSFAGGNVVSESAIDNVEHLYVTGLEPGDYVLEVRRVDSEPLPVWDVAVAWMLPEPTSRPEDVNGDGVVDFNDLLLVLSAWGDCAGCAEDVDGDGMVGFTDLLLILSAWG